jgi:hypothetical protein
VARNAPDDARLADPGLTGDQRCPARAGGGGAHGVVQNFEHRAPFAQLRLTHVASG